MGHNQPKSETASESGDAGQNDFEIADIYAILTRDPYWLTINQIRRLTDRQITDLYFRKLPGDPDRQDFVFPEPETEEEVRAWCENIAATMGGPGAKEWAERAPKQWAAEKAAREAANG